MGEGSGGIYPAAAAMLNINVRRCMDKKTVASGSAEAVGSGRYFKGAARRRMGQLAPKEILWISVLAWCGYVWDGGDAREAGGVTYPSMPHSPTAARLGILQVTL